MSGVFLQNLPPTTPQNPTDGMNTPAGQTPVVGNIRFIASGSQHEKLRAISGVKLDPSGERQ